MARPANRPKRTPLGIRTNILTAATRPGFVRRYVNDVDDRLQRAQEGSYTFVLDPKQNTSAEGISSDPKEGAARKSVGGGITAYLMEIPEDLYQEDQGIKQRDVSAREQRARPQEIKGPQHGGNYGGFKIDRAGTGQTNVGD